MSDRLLHVAVLLSSYNGEKFVGQQIESVLAQRGVRVSLIIRDDGSSDKTLSISKRYEAEYANVRVISGNNIGYVKSFFELVDVADDADFYAFCDQDDVWCANKLIAAVERLYSFQSTPALYFSRTEYVDVNLKHIGFSAALIESRIGYGNALVQNVGAGCTMVFNHVSRQLIRKEFPKYCLVHDWWVYLVVSAFGTVIYDPRSFIKYRQHSGNAIGGSAKKMRLFSMRVKLLISKGGEVGVSRQLSEFSRIFGSRLSAVRQRTLRSLCLDGPCFFCRLTVAVSGGFFRSTRFESFLLRVSILFGFF